MKVAVIGGGFTGCMAALHGAQEGHEVTLLETGERLGGVLRDVEAAGGLYFNGCQYLREGSVNRLGWSDAFIEFSHEYGSVTALGNGQIRVVNDCAQPSLDGKVYLSDVSSIEGSALQRLHAYGAHAPGLINWARSFGDLEHLDWRCLIPMQLSRLHFPDDPEIPKWKMESQCANELLAIPRRQRGQMAEKAWLPRKGYKEFFVRMEQAMLDLGVTIRLQSPVKPSLEGDQLILSSRSDQIPADAVVWTANPQPLFSRLFGTRLDTPPIPMKLLVGDLRKDAQLPVSLPYYWQVFDSSSCVVRLYIYELGGVLKFSAETFDSVDSAAAWRDLQRVMQLCGLGQGHQLVSVSKQTRYVNFSPEEHQAFETLTPEMLAHGVVPGGWQYYGREEKVTSILSSLDELLQAQTEVTYA
ncbi:FAD-dependent oxidoreductase [Limnohabitans radicicola]|uniref:FAD-dependent oxidoreductase n=1 Tax=Limnohabitans radicicola TaxID=2771427 RepID=A0A927FE73_9BURK|nr:FAD-dependent oxidoreductase [Limnohabitans radicicola]MBD8048962.1 FAD-dependent oxidoreductase [Limnohabitans radicicola]